MSKTPFDNTDNKVDRLLEDTEANKNEISKLSKVNIKKISISFAKQIGKIPIFVEVLVPPPPSGSIYTSPLPFLYYEIDLEGFPEWVLPYIRLMPVYHLENGQEFIESNEGTVVPG